MSQAGSLNNNSSGSGSNPSSFISNFDDFLASDDTIGQLDWSQIDMVADNGTATNPGIAAYISPSISPQGISLAQNVGGTMKYPFIFGGGSFSMNFVIDIATLSDGANNYVQKIGLTDAVVTGLLPFVDANNGLYFEYNHAVNGGKWQIVANTGGVTTTSDSGVLASIGFHNYGLIINAAATSVIYTIDGVIVGTIGTNIPLVALAPCTYSNPSAGNLPMQLIDLFYYRQTLTTTREF